MNRSLLLQDLTLHRLAIPFHQRFTHSSASRVETSSLWVEALSRSGMVGHGESCPRDYVTGESLESGLAFFRRHVDSVKEQIHDVESLRRYVTHHHQEIDHHPAAWCAIELALLDLIAKTLQQSVEAALSLPELCGEFRYSAVLGSAAASVFEAQVAQYCDGGFTDFKLKLSGKPVEDRRNVSILRQAGSRSMRLRVDANNLWQSAREAIQYLEALDGALSAIEEPLAPNRYDDLVVVHDSMSKRIILDESFLRSDQFAAVRQRPEVWIINLRVSKMGGLVRSLEIVQEARALGIPVVVGAQVGETSLLTRAALTIASAARNILFAQEGAFGTWLLKSDVCSPSIMFGTAGVLDAGTFLRPEAVGFGIDILDKLPFRIPMST